MKTSPKAIAVVLGMILLCPGFPGRCTADSYEEKTETILADVIVFRPAGVILTVGGAALFAVILPATLISGGTRDTAHTLVKTPFDFTFRRPIGTDLRDYVDY